MLRQTASVTRHTSKLMRRGSSDPLACMLLPDPRESTVASQELDDPIGNRAHMPVPFLTHRYPDRVLIHATARCAQYCRFCFRRARVGKGAPEMSGRDFARILGYLRRHRQVDEAILSGGDPLTLSDHRLDALLRGLRSVKSIRRIRIHTRIPVVLPARVTPRLVALLRRRLDAEHLVYVVTHFNHAREIAAQNVAAIARLVDAGIVVKNQSVLLRGVNDDADALADLFKRLTDIRVQPYYLHQLDLAKGTNHFRVPLERGRKIMRELQRRVTGLAVPQYVLDIPGGLGKVPIPYAEFAHKAGRKYVVRGLKGERVEYTEPKVQP